MTASTRPGAGWRRACVAGLLGLAALSALASTVGVFPLEAELREALLRHVSPGVEAFARWVNYGGGWQFLLPATLVLLAVSPAGRRHWWLWASVLPLGALGEGALKTLVGRTRPEGAAMGFPSGHVTAAAAFAVMMIYLAMRARLGRPGRQVVLLAAVALIGLVSFARIALGAHWPSDVLGGLALGVGVAAAAAWWHAGGLAGPGPTGPAPGRAGPRGERGAP